MATGQAYTTSFKMQLTIKKLKHKRYYELSCLQVRITGTITPVSVDVIKFCVVGLAVSKMW
jgi:hypothetical protein